MITSPTNRISCYEAPDEEGLEGLREKMVRELELDLSYALGREGVTRQGWGMRQVSCSTSAKSGGSGAPGFYPSP